MTPEEKELSIIAGFADRANKVSWKRYNDKMKKQVQFVNSIQDKILLLEKEKMAALDLISETRKIMVEKCIHPKELLVHKGDYIECKFCNKKLRLPPNE